MFRFSGAFLLFSGLIWANAAGPPAGVAGAPGEADCTSCHGSSSGPGKLTIALSAGGTSYVPGATVKVKVTLEDPSATRWGFQLTARKSAATDTGAGKITSSGNLTFAESLGGADYISHSPNGTFRGTRNSASWEFDWTAPAAGTGSVTFYAAGNAANNNTTETGDRIYRGSFQITEASSGGGGGTVTPTARTHSVPQVAFGGGFASTLYFVNSTDAEVSFDINFYQNNGTALSLGGSDTQKITIAARGLAAISAPNEGGLIQGWAGADLPDGVTGFNLLRLATENQADRELVISFAKTIDQQKALVVFDDSVINTQIAVSNPSSADATITGTVRDDKGATVGTTTLALKAGSGVVFVLKDKVADAGGKRGTVEFSTGAGAVAATAIRFGGANLVSAEAPADPPQE